MFTNTLFVSYLVCLIVVFFNPIDVVLSGDESILLSCGSKDGGTDSDGRKWESDAKYTSSESKMTKATNQDSSLPSTIPYMTARVFTKEGTYNLSVKKYQRYWLRFYFYPATYPDLNITNSYFSLDANGITLLNNFSASITAQAAGQAFFFEEYSLAPMDSDNLELTFKPSDKYPGSFAFINGIEFVPIPDLFDKAPLVGFSDQTMEMQSSNMQTMFRLNVAGQYIPPKADSDGLMRTWYNDQTYIWGAGIGANIEADDNTTINYKDLPSYVAPPDVYMTARSMGPDAHVNLDYNLTWIFDIDGNFTYLVRLHFCEFVMDSVNQRVFNIYINNQSAQVYPDAADVIAWTKEKNVPTYRDYVIVIDDKPGDKELRVAMSPSPESKPQYYDSILNGLEVFKIEGGKNLAGPNPKIEAPPPNAGSNSKSSQNKDHKTNMNVIGGAAGGAAAFGLLAALCIVVYQRKKRVPGSESHTSSWLPIYGHSHTGSKSTISGKSNASSHISAMAQGLCRRFSLPEIKHATKNFDDSYVIGVGGFGKVYKGVLDDKIKVAIKRSNPSSEQGVNEFCTEIEMLSKLRHKHLVSLIGFCEEDNEMCLVYDYMALGTLREHLYNTKKPTLSWKQRLEICIGAARGLHYLHTGAKYTIIHRDVKTTNILLDENWVAKVSDFGLSKTGPNMENGHVSTVVKGSFGYLDPEYFRRQQLTEKSDIYSFGVVLFEVLCARPALNPSLPKEQVSLADWALHCKKKGVLEDIIDPDLKGKISQECLNKFVDTAEKCLSEVGYERPSMGDVLWNLEFALQLVESPDGASTSDRSYGSEEALLNRNNRSVGSERETNEGSEGSSVIFSQIVNPTGR
ncbi:receptor-like protein kinase ANXUR1 [Pistacia vera]|uniref:receptor-like protein kinase ANXUR1 n=1 Tax=Pistacia vera TaxID=55513 RepID=UPI001263797C|nr:receptor-like protein kinase ANXUR1 [Pistacia vera]